MYSSEETLPRRRRTPSFSSSLLDAIYRSIDESKSDHNHNHNHHHQKMRSQTKKSSSSSSMCERDFEFRYSSNNNNLRRAMMIESWIEKQQSSASSSSESTIWSSSESAEPNPKPTKPRASEPPAKPSSGFSRTKLRALKLYGELKKVRQPISPGGRIASFLTSIFGSGGAGAAGAVKKAKMCYVGADDDVAAAPSSSAKSCLIQEAKGGGGGEKIIRSVRFYPVSVVLGEDSKPCGQRRVRDRDRCDPCLMPLSSSSVRRSFEKKSGVIRRFCDDHHDDDEEDDDDLSYSSSDLFEIDHHRVVGVGRYREELPVYETTSLKTNQAIANGLIF